jgi:hypothetical protein
MELPTIKQELERKTVSTLSDLAEQFERGEIAHAEFYTAVSAMCDVVSGLVDVELLTLLSRARTEIAG